MSVLEIFKGSCTAHTLSMSSISPFRTSNPFNARSISGFHTASWSNTRSISGFYTAHYCGLEYYSEYFTRMLKYFGVLYSRYSDYSRYCRCSYCGYCLYSSMCTAHTLSTRSIWAISTAYIQSTPSMCAASTIIFSVLGVRNILSRYSEYTREYRVYSEHPCSIPQYWTPSTYVVYTTNWCIMYECGGGRALFPIVLNKKISEEEKRSYHIGMLQLWAETLY